MAVREPLSSARRVNSVLSRVMEVAGISFFSTVTTQVASFSPALAVMVALPGATAFTWPSVTVATEASDELQVTLGSVASAGRTVANNSASSPSTKVKEDWFKAMELTGINLFSTVTVQVASFSPALAVMVAFPSFTATTFPPATVATEASEVLQVTLGSVASAGRTVADNTASSPSTKVKVDGLKAMELTGMNFFSTVTSQVASFSPALAVIVVLPGFNVLTFPPSTVATEASEELQVTEGSVASAGSTVADKTASSPSTRVKVALSNSTELTGINFFSTVTSQVADFSPERAVTVAFPGFSAFTLPSATLATKVSEELQLMLESVASSGRTVDFNSASSPSTRVKADGLSATESTGMNFFSTTISQRADFSPARAVTVALPGVSAITLPSATFATKVSELLQLTSGWVAFSGRTVAFSVASLPSSRAIKSKSSATDSTAISGAGGAGGGTGTGTGSSFLGLQARASAQTAAIQNMRRRVFITQACYFGKPLSAPQ